MPLPLLFFFFFFNDTATTEIYTLSLHDALPISSSCRSSIPCSLSRAAKRGSRGQERSHRARASRAHHARSEEHTSELQSPCNLVCRLLLEKKKNNTQQVEHILDKSVQHTAARPA